MKLKYGTKQPDITKILKANTKYKAIIANGYIEIDIDESKTSEINKLKAKGFVNA